MQVLTPFDYPLTPQIMIRGGFTDDALDAETRRLLLEAEGVRSADEGVETVLVLALQVIAA
jgi:hypothetical protein